MANRRVAINRWKVSDKRNVDEIAEMLGISEWDEISELNQDYYWEATHDGREDGESEEDHEERHFKARQDVEDEDFRNWHDSVMHAADRAFGDCGLELVPITKKAHRGNTRPYDYRIVPKKSWNDAAEQIMDVINGIGMFGFSSLKEFLSSGPYTAREAVLEHLGYVEDRHKVYGDISPKSMYERHRG